MKSPNFTQGNSGISMYVLHKTMGSYEGAVEWLCTPPEKRSPKTYSSAHFVIARDGSWAQLVSIKDTAWHAGTVDRPTEYAKRYLKKNMLSAYLNPNSYSIGIEFAGLEQDDVTDAQTNTCAQIMMSIGLYPILTHKEITAGKSDFMKTGAIDTSPRERVQARIDQLTTKLNIF